MTNRELLKKPPDQLSPSERQRRHCLQKELTPVPCPVCKKPLDAITATGIDLDAYDPSKTDAKYCCPECKSELEIVVPFIAFGPGWHWEVKHEWLTAMLAKAWAYDRDTQRKEQ